jgi:signal transduction histidine kinase
VRLYLQIYATVVGVAVLCVISAATLAVVLSDRAPFEEDARDVAEVFVDALPADPALRQARAERLAERLGGDVALWDADGRVVVATGDVPFGPPGAIRGWRGHGRRLDLSDGRVVGYFQPPNPRRHLRLVALLAVLALVVAVGTWPVSRRLTSRLEGLRSGAVAWGEGQLDARVPDAGSDEVAQVAQAFNRAADRVQKLVDAQRRVLASASHELRSPLARLRMTLELLDEEGTDPRVQRAIRDVEELDDTVGDVLDASRMEAAEGVADPELVDLRALLDGLGPDVQAEGERYLVAGDPRLLRRMLRNVVENARKYGAPPIVARIEADGLSVTDGGTAPDAAAREAMFEPFYRPQGHAEGVHGGVGLGLALVRQIARHHGGDAELGARDGRTSLRVRLPRVEA